jgi:hypothetical protein
MGSELVRGLVVARGVRRVCVEGRDVGVLNAAGDSGAIVAPSRLASSPSTVVPVSGSTAPPHEAQNLAVAKTCAPHFEQNMGGGILPLVTALRERARK